MDSQKAENLLNLAMDATKEERERSLTLEIGLDSRARTWDLILRYSGELSGVRALAQRTTELLGGYAVVTVREDRIGDLEALSEVEYIEKPKLLYFQTRDGKRASCAGAFPSSSSALRGKGVLIGIIDSGIDLTHMDFRNPDGTTRIFALWDQSATADEAMGYLPPEGYAFGVEYTREQIDAALSKAASADGTFSRLPSSPAPGRDVSGHGTAVAGIAAGSGAQYEGMAPESELIVVKLANPQPGGFPRTTELIQAIDYTVRMGAAQKKPLAVNLSFGNTYGSHDGTSLLERYMDGAAGYGRTCVCVGMGNEGASAGHTSGRLKSGQEERIPLAVQELQTGLDLQIWKSYADTVELSVISPSGARIGPFREVLGTQRFFTEGTELLLYYGEPSPYSVNQEIFIDMLPKETYVDAGLWTIVLTAGKVVDGRYDLWLPGGGIVNTGTGFRYPTPDCTLTIPACASRVVSVGAYDASTLAYADFSGRGPLPGAAAGLRMEEEVRDEIWGGKPDLVAPGVDIVTTAAGGGYQAVSGTSFAAPFVTGAAALLMEWGIVRGNDPYLYGEKVKAYLQRGAKPLRGYAGYPNPKVGYGALCVRESLPEWP